MDRVQSAAQLLNLLAMRWSRLELLALDGVLLFRDTISILALGELWVR